MRSAHLLAAALASLNILASAGMQAADSPGCAGVVVDENGVPLGGVQLKLEHSSGKTYGAEPDGARRCTLRDLSARDYTLEDPTPSCLLLPDTTRPLHAGA